MNRAAARAAERRPWCSPRRASGTSRVAARPWHSRVVAVWLFWTSYLGLGVVCTVFELLRPAHKVSYRKGVPFDVVAMAVYQFGIAPLALILTSQVQIRYHGVDGVPLAVRIVALYL